MHLKLLKSNSFFKYRVEQVLNKILISLSLYLDFSYGELLSYSEISQYISNCTNKLGECA